ncbi:MAG: histidine kinase [Urechidicola sp.]|nr:histidine kinase [Urechidicola sp.]
MFTDLNSEIFAWIRGGFFILAIYHLLLYFQNGKKLYLYYCLYLLTFFAFFASRLFQNIDNDIILGFFSIPMFFLTSASFYALTRTILETKSRIPKWDHYFKIATVVSIGIAFLFFVLQLFLGSEFSLSFVRIIGPFYYLFVIITAFVVLETKLKSAIYFSVSTFLFAVLGLITLMQYYVGAKPFFEINIIPIFFLYIGAFIQSMSFAYIIGLSVKRVEMQNKSAEIKLAFKYKELEELKMTALQSQMNPHFLFNSLNSINNFVLKSEVEKASDYITKFSRLIRVILKSSTSLTVPFSEELGILSLYVKLEQMRINGGFEYVVKIDKDIRLEDIKVPPLFLQPFIENSIWHGLTHVEGDKRISLTISKEGDNIICEIIDNGIGIDTAREHSHKKVDRRKFFGTQATENRIQLLYKKANVDIDVVDISDETSTGTKVKITFPHILKV